ncbi:MAG: hypothetical protein J6S67_23500 [Methanobrevibacter sp.]|nr:hypothetical protein [Methanobrevibacter sp.]
MTISDLTGTTWVFPDGTELSPGSNLNFAITFISNSENYTGIYSGSDPEIMYYVQNGSHVIVYDQWGNQWTNNAYRTIGITGGTDVTNATLISWLEANATQQSSQLSVDLSTLSGWPDVSDGTHTLTIKAKATGYRDSNPSTGVSIVKIAAPSLLDLGNTIVITDNDGEATYYDIYWNGTLVTSIPKTVSS